MRQKPEGKKKTFLREIGTIEEVWPIKQYAKSKYQILPKKKEEEVSVKIETLQHFTMLESGGAVITGSPFS